MKIVKEADTAKCPDCGNKYLVKTGYCMSCKKKVGGKKKEAFVVPETFKIPGTETIIEKGTEIEVSKLNENMKKIEDDLSIAIANLALRVKNEGWPPEEFASILLTELISGVTKLKDHELEKSYVKAFSDMISRS